MHCNDVARITDRIVVDENDPIEGCWRWLGWLTTKGYVFELFTGQRVVNHLVMDHFVCRNRACVNPRHVEPVTNHENILRGIVPTANRVLCKSGRHVLGDVGIYVDSEGTERCHQCRLESKRRYRQRLAA